jgi:hypothetical protein
MSKITTKIGKTITLVILPSQNFYANLYITGDIIVYF